jgi:2-polyprenyl-3-methyl-5-hydroxy-6-metoxy-1,4-benzoquinol methylase
MYDLSNPRAHAGVGLPGVVKRCKSCNLQFKSFSLKAENLYNAKYAQTFLDTKEYSSDSAIQFFKDILKHSLAKMKPSGKKPALLDIGSGVGTMLQAATESGYQPVGVELSADLVKVAVGKGFTVINKNVSELSLNEQFDTITMMDIIEHLESPKEILRELKPLLKSDGLLVVYTPNHNSLIVKIADLMYKTGIKSPIENIFACTHTVFFTTETLKKHLTESGYEIVKVRHFNYDISRPGQKVSAVAKLGVSVLEKIGNLTSFNGFRLVIFARHKNSTAK